MTQLVQPPGPPSAQQVLQDIMCECHRSAPRVPDGLDRCKRQGIENHACCENAIQNHKPPPEIGGEKGYDKKGAPTGQTRSQMEAAGTLKGTMWPDACAMAGGKPTQFFDFKFPCGGDSDGDFYLKKKGGVTQYEKYLKLGKKLGITEPPVALTSRSC